MKHLPLITVFLLSFAASLNAQSLPAPDTIKPTTTLPAAEVPTVAPTSNAEKMAEEAQKSVFDAIDANGAVKGAPTKTVVPSNGLAPAPMITTRTDGSTRTTFSRPPLSKLDDPAFWPRDSVHQIAVMEVKIGKNIETVVIELFPSDAPQTVANFVERCESKAYDGLAFHRAIENFLVQTGDPLTADEDKRDDWGTGGEEKLPPEIKRTHRLGTVAMARRSDKVNPSRRSNSSQFYFALGNFGLLDGQYTVFGQVVEGLDVLQHIAKMPVDSNDCPIARIEVDSIRIMEQKGPLIARTNSSGKRTFRPGKSEGFFERVLSRVW